MIINLLYVILSVFIAIFAIVHLITHRRDYGTSLIYLTLIFLYILDHGLFFTFFILSTRTYFPPSWALFLWKASIVFLLTSMAVMQNVIHSFSLGYKKKLRTFTAIYYSLLASLIVGFLFHEDSITLLRHGDHYHYMEHPVISVLIFIYYMSIILIGGISQWRVRNRTRRPMVAKLFFLVIGSFLIILIMYNLYIVSDTVYSKNNFIICYLLGGVVILYIALKKPELFVLITNKIDEFIIFHKSGILLYSFDFKSGEEIGSSIKGSILIGINHILSSFVNKKTQINVIKMEGRDIILEYDVSLGIALLLITNNRNQILEKRIANFMQDFTTQHGAILRSIEGDSRLIDVSQFKGAKKVLRKHFKPYFS